MATAKIEFVVGAQTSTNTRTISGPDLVRFINAYRTYTGMAAGTTDAQVLAQVAQDSFRTWRGIVKSVEQQAAIKTAADGVTDIGMT